MGLETHMGLEKGDPSYHGEKKKICVADFQFSLISARTVGKMLILWYHNRTVVSPELTNKRHNS